jgi:hypothetical protein
MPGPAAAPIRDHSPLMFINTKLTNGLLIARLVTPAIISAPSEIIGS